MRHSASVICAPEWQADIENAGPGSPEEPAVLGTVRTVFEAALIDHLEEMGLPIPADLYEEPLS